MSVEDQVASIFAGTQGFLDGIPVEDVNRFEEALLADLHENHAEVMDRIRDTKDLADDTKAKLKDAVAAFAKTFG